MNAELERYLDGRFVLLIVSVAADLAGTTVESFGGWLVPTAGFGLLGYVFVVNPDALHRSPGGREETGGMEEAGGSDR